MYEKLITKTTATGIANASVLESTHTAPTDQSGCPRQNSVVKNSDAGFVNTNK